MADLLRYLGLKADGAPCTSSTTTKTVSELAESLQNRGWRSAVITDDQGRAVARVAEGRWWVVP